MEFHMAKFVLKEVLLEQCAEQNISQTRLSEKCGLHRGCVGRLMAIDDPAVMSVETLMALADGLSIPPSAFFAETPTRRRGRKA